MNCVFDGRKDHEGQGLNFSSLQGSHPGNARSLQGKAGFGFETTAELLLARLDLIGSDR